MKNLSAYNNFLEHAVLYPSSNRLEYNYNNKGPLLPGQKESTNENDIFKNFTYRRSTLEGVVVAGATHGVYYESKKPYKGNVYEIYIYEPNDDNTILVTKIDAKMAYKKTFLGKPNFEKPVIKITSIKASKVTKESNEVMYNKITEHITKLEKAKVNEKKQLDYKLKHSGEEYEKELRKDYYGSPWR